MSTTIHAVEGTTDRRFQMLAREIYERLALTDRISFEEILENDVYFQIGDQESFTFSVEVRGDDTEFFLYNFNFMVSNESDFDTYKENILDVVESAVQGDYHIEFLQVGERVVKSEIVFKNSLRIGLYDGLFFSGVQMVHSQAIDNIGSSTRAKNLDAGRRSNILTILRARTV